MTASDVTLLPQPDSPTSPRVRPRCQRQVDAVDGAHGAVVGGEGNGKLAQFEQRYAHSTLRRQAPFDAGVDRGAIEDAGRILARRHEGAEVRPALAAHRLRAAPARAAARHDRRRAGRARNIPGCRRSPARPTACRACRRRPFRRPSWRRSGAAAGASRRSRGRSARSRRRPAGPASMLPATDMSSPIQWPHHGTHSAPVWAANLPSAPMTWSWRCSRPASGVVRMRTTSAAATPSRIRRSPCGP